MKTKQDGGGGKTSLEVFESMSLWVQDMYVRFRRGTGDLGMLRTLGTVDRDDDAFIPGSRDASTHITSPLSSSIL